MSEVDETTSERVVDLAPSVAAGVLESLGAESVISFPDLLTHGPVSSDSKRHRKERLKYLRDLYSSLYPGGAEADKSRVDALMRPLEKGYLTTEQLGSAAGRAAKGGRFVIWTTPTFEDRLFLWFACSALLEEGIAHDRISIAEAQILFPSDNPDEARYANLSQLEEEDFEAVFDDLFYPEPIYIDTAANLWETFATVSPRQMAKSVGHTRKFFPQFFVFIQDYAFLFPQATDLGGRRRLPEGVQPLHLSEFDADLFAKLSDTEFRSAEDVIDDDILEKYEYLGELVVLARLQVWSKARKGEEPYIIVEMNDDSDASDPLTQFKYKLSARGSALLNDGFEAGRKLPIFTVGNARTYASKTPWVSVRDGFKRDFERFSPAE